jgi:hypothetical protein
MVWTNEAIIAMAGLFAACAPLGLLLHKKIVRRRQRRTWSQGKIQAQIKVAI